MPETNNSSETNGVSIGLPKLVGLVLLSLAPLYFIFYDFPEDWSGRSLDAVFAFGHLGAFCFWTSLFLIYKPKDKLDSFYGQLFFTLCICFLCGIVIEFIQPYFGRHRSLDDIWMNMLGTALGVVFLSPARKQMTNKIKYSLQIAVALGVVIQLYPVYVGAADDYYAYKKFPIIADFSTPYELDRWADRSTQVQLLKHHIIHDIEDASVSSWGEKPRDVLEASFTTQKYSTLELKYFIGDWSGRRKFLFTVFNPYRNGVALSFTIKDRISVQSKQSYSDRYNGGVILKPGWNTLEVPLTKLKAKRRDRSFDLSRIESLLFFTNSLKEEKTLYFDMISLVD